MKRRLIGCLLAIVSTAGAATLSLEGAVQAALAGDRELRAAREEIAAAEARFRAAGRLSDPAFQVEVAGGRDFEGRVELGFAQRFPLTARLRLEKSISRLAVEAAACEVAMRERAVAATVREAYFRLAGARAAVALLDRQEKLGGAFVESVDRRIGEGLASALDAGDAALERDRFRISADGARAAIIDAEQDFCTRLGLPMTTPVELSTSLAVPGNLPPFRPPADPPAVRLAEIAAEAAETDIRLARALGWEDVEIGLFVEGERFRDEPEGIEPEGLIGMRVSLPLPLWRDTKSEVRSREAAARARTERLQAVKLEAANAAIAARRRMEARHRAAVRTERGALPAARKLVEETEAAHRRGEIDLQQVLRVRARAAEVETAGLESAVQYHIEHARWLDAVGQPSKP